MKWLIALTPQSFAFHRLRQSKISYTIERKKRHAYKEIHVITHGVEIK